MGRIEGKVALVTGAASGLGRAIALMLAREGAQVALADINEAGAKEVAGEIHHERPGAAQAFKLDVTSEQQWQDTLAAVVARFGRLNILVNNAGISAGSDIESTDFATWKRVHEVDLDSVFLGCKHAIRHIAASGGGSIVNVSSVAGIIAGHNTAAYNSAKAAVRHLTKSVALHCAKQKNGVRCNSVHPTFIKTPILGPLVERLGEREAYAKLGRQIPLGHIGEPDDVAYAVLYLASDESKFVTGSELVVDGGISAM